jgi:hypothetical protein
VWESSVSSNPHNVLSGVVTVRVRAADSVAVRYAVGGVDVSTPAVIPAADSVRVPVLGLLPGTRYLLQAVAFGGGRAALGEVLAFTTGPLPEDLPRFTATGSAPYPGFVVMAAGRYGLVIDNTGRVVWYRHFPESQILNFQAQPNGRYAARPQVSVPGRPAEWVEFDPLGNPVRALACAGGLQPRPHDLLSGPDGSYWILCDETRVLDLTRLGGPAETSVTGTVVQHISAAGVTLFEWSVFDHFTIGDLDPGELAEGIVNWTHGNALDLDSDGNLLLSFRNLSEITKINVASGEVMWRMGGTHNQFVFENLIGAPFARQHGVRAILPGVLILLDNLGNPSGTDGERFAYDAATRTARLVASYRASPPVTGHLGGTTQHLGDGRVLVSFGSGARVIEYDAAGTEQWHIEDAGYVFRAQRILSLYAPGAHSSR